MAIPLLAVAGFGTLVTAVSTFFSAILKHPIIVKMAVFTMFTSIVLFAIDYIKSLIVPYVTQNDLLAIASYLGLLDALSLYITIIVAGFGVKQILAFIRTV